jgi:predicted small metal-binding protein
MAKMLKCGDVFSGCDTVIYGKDEEGVVAKAQPKRRWFGLR